MKRSLASLSILAATISLFQASPSLAAEIAMTELKSTTGARVNRVATSPGMVRSTGDASKAVAGNTGGSGRSGVNRTLNERALNPQPLPPVERGRGSATSGDRAALPNGIIIVGGKSGGAR